MALGFTCNSATNGNCTQISWLVNVLTKIQSSLHFSLHSRLRAFPVMCLPGFIPIWETEFSRVRMFPDKHIPEFIHSPIRAGIHFRIEPSAALFWALGIVPAHILKQLTQPTGPASLKYGRGQLGSI